MVSLGTGYFDPESLSSGDAQRPSAPHRHFPIFKHTTPPTKTQSSVITSHCVVGGEGSEADDEATTNVSARSKSSSSSDPSAKLPLFAQQHAVEGQPPITEVSNRNNKRALTGSSAGETTSSLSTHTPPSIVAEREHFPLFTDEDECSSIGEGRAGESFSSTTTCSSHIPWSSVKLTPNEDCTTPIFTAFNAHDRTTNNKDAPLLPSGRKPSAHSSSSSQSTSQAERGRQLARVLLDQARTKQTTTKKRRVSFARTIRLTASDAGSSASTSTSSSSGEGKVNDHHPCSNHPPEHRPLASRHVLSKRSKVRTSLLRRAVQSLRRRKDFMDNLFELPSEDANKQVSDAAPKTLDSSSLYDQSTISAVTARNRRFAGWDKYLPVRNTVQKNGHPETPPRNNNNAKRDFPTPDTSPSRASVASEASSLFRSEPASPVVVARSQGRNNNESPECKADGVEAAFAIDRRGWCNEGLSGRMDRDAMLQQLGFLPTAFDKKQHQSQSHGLSNSVVSREDALKALGILDGMWEDDDEAAQQQQNPVPCSSVPPTIKATRRHASKPPLSPMPPETQQLPPTPQTVSILGVVLVNYPQLVRNQVNHFRRHVLNISDAVYSVWATAQTTTTTTTGTPLTNPATAAAGID